MYNLIRFYNQNRKKIFKIILVIVFIIAIIQLLNYFAKKQNESDENININVESNITYEQEVISNKSAVSGTTVKGEKLQKDTEVIHDFFEYCNQGNIEQAYSVLTDECKEEMYPTLDDFKRIYYEYLFNGEKKSYTIENWTGSIYRVRITGDILSTGKLNENETRQDYMTVVQKDGEYKLNINSYVGRTTPNKTTENKDIKITVKSIDTYMDYEIYNLYIENNSSNDVLLDTDDDTKAVYLLDSNEKKYYYYNNEVLQNKLLVQSKLKSNLEIKFMSSYGSTKKIKSLVFSKMILNYQEYRNLDDKKQFTDFCKFEVNI